MTAAAKAPPALLTWNLTAREVGLSARTVRRLVASGNFPDPIKVPGLSGWRFRRVDIDVWLDELAERALKAQAARNQALADAQPAYR